MSKHESVEATEKCWAKHLFSARVMLLIGTYSGRLSTRKMPSVPAGNTE